MSTSSIIDSHIHLWPAETANEDGHAWMTPGMPLAKAHLLSSYRKAADQHDIQGVVYVETDVRYEEPHGDVAAWARGPLDEIRFLRRAVEGHYDLEDSKLLVGLVPWAPMDQPMSVLKDYLLLAEEAAEQEAWKRVKGFRYLLQFTNDQTKFKAIALSPTFVNNLKLLGRKGHSFDVGVDQRSGGIWQLEIVAQAMSMAHQDADEDEKVIFVVNHLCKPNFEASESEFKRWCEAISAMASLSKSYMKLSGGFSELPSTVKGAGDTARHMRPWIKHLMQTFGPSRIMFGSDWPVCNVSGPMGEQSWVAWNHVVKAILKDEVHGLTEDDCQAIWFGTARKAYRLDASP